MTFPTTALADGPPEVYSDFAEDGVLSCGHSRSALKAVLNDASIHQYGDPLTLIGLKHAIRKQLAGGCRRSEGRLDLSAQAGSENAPLATTESKARSATLSRPKAGSGPRRAESEPFARPATAGGSTGGRRDGRMVLLGVVLLLLTLGSGGWAVRRAFTDRP
jgi:hypothetical protein